MNHYLNRGFSLLELLIVIALISVIALVSAGMYRNYAKSVELEYAARGIAADLKTARAKAMAGEDQSKWGVHFVNSTSDYYELFSTPSTYSDAAMSVKATTTLAQGITFFDPLELAVKNVIFSRVTGATTATTVAIMSENRIATTTVTAVGNIY